MRGAKTSYVIIFATFLKLLIFNILILSARCSYIYIYSCTLH